MKRAPRKRSLKQAESITPAEMLAYVDFLVAEHDTAWERELLSSTPRWPVMLGLHLRICELEHLQEAAGELLL